MRWRRTVMSFLMCFISFMARYRAATSHQSHFSILVSSSWPARIQGVSRPWPPNQLHDQHVATIATTTQTTLVCTSNSAQPTATPAMDAPPPPPGVAATASDGRAAPDAARPNPDPDHGASAPTLHHARYTFHADPRWRMLLSAAGPLLGIPAATRDRVLRDTRAYLPLDALDRLVERPRPDTQLPRLVVLFHSAGASARAGRVTAHWLAHEWNEVGDYVARDTVRAMVLSPARVESGTDEVWTRVDVQVVTIAPVAPVRGVDARAEAAVMRRVRRGVRAREAKREMHCEWDALEEVVDEMVRRAEDAGAVPEVELAVDLPAPPPTDANADGMDVDVAADHAQEPPPAAAASDHDRNADDADASDSDHDSALAAIPPSSAFADCLERLLRAHVLDDPLANVDVMAVLADPDDAGLGGLAVRANPNTADPDADPDAIPLGALGEGDSADDELDDDDDDSGMEDVDTDEDAPPLPAADALAIVHAYLRDRQAAWRRDQAPKIDTDRIVRTHARALAGMRRRIRMYQTERLPAMIEKVLEQRCTSEASLVAMCRALDVLVDDLCREQFYVAVIVDHAAAQKDGAAANAPPDAAQPAAAAVDDDAMDVDQDPDANADGDGDDPEWEDEIESDDAGAAETADDRDDLRDFIVSDDDDDELEDDDSASPPPLAVFERRSGAAQLRLMAHLQRAIDAYGSPPALYRAVRTYAALVARALPVPDTLGQWAPALFCLKVQFDAFRRARGGYAPLRDVWSEFYDEVKRGLVANLTVRRPKTDIRPSVPVVEVDLAAAASPVSPASPASLAAVEPANVPVPAPAPPPPAPEPTAPTMTPEVRRRRSSVRGTEGGREPRTVTPPAEPTVENAVAFGQHPGNRILLSSHNGKAIYLPAFLDTRLKPYQVEGVRFMWKRIHEDKTGAILAYAMGLGKTLQAITFIYTTFFYMTRVVPSVEDLRTRCVVIMAPKTVAPNWVTEFDKWIWPEYRNDVGLHVHLVNDVLIPRRVERIKQWARQGGVLILTYPMLTSLCGNEQTKDVVEKDVFGNASLWVFDEAHIFKNEKTQLSTLFHKHFANSPARRIGLTGTPLQNSLIEYYNLTTIVGENLGSREEFRDKCERPIMAGQNSDSTPAERKRAAYALEFLGEFLADIVLRRDNSLLKQDLPPLYEYVVYLDVTREQKALVRTFLQNRPSADMGVGSHLAMAKRFTQIFNHPTVFMRALRKPKVARAARRNSGNDGDDAADPCAAAAAAPAKRRVPMIVLDDEGDGYQFIDVDDLSDEEVDGTAAATAADAPPAENPLAWLDEYTAAHDLDAPTVSSKMDVCLALLEQFRSGPNKEKAIVFSQSVQSLEFLAAALRARAFHVCFLHGGTEDKTGSGKSPNSMRTTARPPVGPGVNLVAASRVIIFDFQWNPTSEEQAIGRAFRLGQTKPVVVYRLVVQDTFEHGMFKTQVKKSALAQQALDKITLPKLFSKREVNQYFRADRLNARFDPDMVMPRDAAVLAAAAPDDAVLQHVVHDLPWIVDVKNMDLFFAPQRIDLDDHLIHDARQQARRQRSSRARGAQVAPMAMEFPEELLTAGPPPPEQGIDEFDQDRALVEFNAVTLPHAAGPGRGRIAEVPAAAVPPPPPPRAMALELHELAASAAAAAGPSDATTGAQLPSGSRASEPAPTASWRVKERLAAALFNGSAVPAAPSTAAVGANVRTGTSAATPASPQPAANNGDRAAASSSTSANTATQQPGRPSESTPSPPPLYVQTASSSSPKQPLKAPVVPPVVPPAAPHVTAPPPPPAVTPPVAPPPRPRKPSLIPIPYSDGDPGLRLSRPASASGSTQAPALLAPSFAGRFNETTPQSSPPPVPVSVREVIVISDSEDEDVVETNKDGGKSNDHDSDDDDDDMLMEPDPPTPRSASPVAAAAAPERPAARPTVPNAPSFPTMVSSSSSSSSNSWGSATELLSSNLLRPTPP
ncbi:hypothetical protein AMAG_16256 [Allomyces macrogynus ATCC 38327]|uniref:Helicase ATP-binding domain-containing protein n=1 Tax=Allomyces macrogynus (strain ATCC 38327) TaxID=578462 RepID=A0A0L0TAX4_ALLM3|nr:hypothetical protein AMAG_16256 [Allomyces macrogynus ATCC 38327]|eukprot:KNE71704.1 hypothetical protein AMAG_16256 [Allomyces macrogynus ATCC 38327]